MLNACASQPAVSVDTTPQYQSLDKNVLMQISASAQSINMNIQRLNLVENSKYGKPAMPFDDIKDAILDKKITTMWYGPLHALLKQVTGLIDYKLQVYGYNPAFPVIVNVGNGNIPASLSIIDLLRDLQVQAKTQADIFIYPEQKLISIRYKSIDAKEVK
ncbi:MULTISPECIES: DotD/TraH family lipoprotein [Cysteiniphilum]|uniref:DotD/TraH family lipoprotein n=1 Tax=Cysteiniphilum TaxID=2056696 RepID=UPI001786EC84|nr:MULTISPECIES: DotD/TraH family lipoprotein [Cysteiniphilum]